MGSVPNLGSGCSTGASAVIFGVGVLAATASVTSCSRGPVKIACPRDPVGPAGTAVSDNFYFVHRPLSTNGTVTARLRSLTGIITYPPPRHDRIVAGLVPWAKAGLIIKANLRPGSSYAAVMMTGSHGIRMQYDYVHDIGVSPTTRLDAGSTWLRLTRHGDLITTSTSRDGKSWSTVATTVLQHLGPTIDVGLFVASPGDVSLRQCLPSRRAHGCSTLARRSA